MKYIDADKLRAEIERLEAGRSFREAGAYKRMYRVIDSLQQEQPTLPNNLDEAAREIVIKMHPCLKDCTILGDRLTRGQLMALVKAGAEWMASQMPMPEDTVIFMKGVAEGRRLEREDKNDDNLPRITDEDFKRAVRDEYAIFVDGDPVYSKLVNQVVGLGIAKHFADLGVKWVKEEKSSKDNELPRYYGD